MKERGFVVGATVGRAVVLSRAALIRALAGLAFEVDVKTSVAGQRIKPWTPVSNERI
jgi:hypothetical protein